MAHPLIVGSIRLDGGGYLVWLTADPTAGAGVVAPIGTVGSRSNAGAGEFWLKTAAADTAWSQVTSGSHGLGSATHTAATLAELSAKVSDATLIASADSRLSDARTPTAHAASHLTAGGDGLTLTDSEIAAANKDGIAGTASMRTLSTGAQTACAGNDARLSDARAPTAHTLGGAAHSADSFADLSALVDDQTLVVLALAQAFTAHQRPVPVALSTGGANIAITIAGSNVFTATINQVTQQLDNPSDGTIYAGQPFEVHVRQDGTGGRALTFDTEYDFGDEGAPDLTSLTSNQYGIVTCEVLSATLIACTYLGGFG